MTKRIPATSLRAPGKFRSTWALVALGFIAWCCPGVGDAQTVTEYNTPSATNPAFDLTNGPDGNLWFLYTDASGKSAIGKLSPTTGAIVHYTAGISANAGISSFAAGPDGNVWFTESATNKIGRITPAGMVTEFSAGLSPAS